MGVYLHYQALPEASRLTRQLRSEQPLCVLYAELIHRPAGPYDFARLAPVDRDNYFDDIAANPVFGSPAALADVYADLQAELARADAEYPELAERSAYFKLGDFELWLARVLAAPGRADAARLASTLIWGGEPFAPAGFGTDDIELHYVSPAVVSEAAAVLRVAGSVTGPDPWSGFRNVYVRAAERGEGMLIG